LIIRCSFWNKNKACEINIAFCFEVWPSQRVTWVLEDVLVEIFILFFFYLRLLSDPKWFVLIYSLEFLCLDCPCSCSIDGILDFLLIDLLSFSFPLFSDFFNLCLDLSISFFNLLFISHCLLQIDWIAYETTICFDKFFKLVIFTILACIFFQMKSH
jgi:hypothetical protein